MNIPEIFKYNSIISIPLFSIISLFLIRKAPDFSFRKHTVSMSILLFNRPTQTLIFRLNFVIKGLLDLGFVWFILHYFKISFESPTAWVLILSALLFGSLAYFIEGKYTITHKVIAYSSGVFWAIGQIHLAKLIGDVSFIQLTNIAVVIPLVLAFGFMFVKKTNVFIQVLCMSMWYIWLVLFVFTYL